MIVCLLGPGRNPKSRAALLPSRPPPASRKLTLGGQTCRGFHWKSGFCLQAGSRLKVSVTDSKYSFQSQPMGDSSPWGSLAWLQVLDFACVLSLAACKGHLPKPPCAHFPDEETECGWGKHWACSRQQRPGQNLGLWTPAFEAPSFKMCMCVYVCWGALVQNIGTNCVLSPKQGLPSMLSDVLVP